MSKHGRLIWKIYYNDAYASIIYISAIFLSISMHKHLLLILDAKL